MPTAEDAIAVALAIVILVSLFPAINSGVADNSGTVEVENESATLSTGSYSELDGFNIVDGSETVYWENTSSGGYDVASAGTDYELNNSAGTIRAVSGGLIDSADHTDEVLVSYSYEATDGTTETVLDQVPLLMLLIALVAVGAYINREL